MKHIADSMESIPFAENNIAEINVDGKIICIAKHQDKLFAFQRTCPHAGAFLKYGGIDPRGILVCPVHHYKFCLENGRNVTGEGYVLRRWKVEIKEDGIFIEGM